MPKVEVHTVASVGCHWWIRFEDFTRLVDSLAYGA